MDHETIAVIGDILQPLLLLAYSVLNHVDIYHLKKDVKRLKKDNEYLEERIRNIQMNVIRRKP